MNWRDSISRIYVQNRIYIEKVWGLDRLQSIKTCQRKGYSQKECAVRLCRVPNPRNFLTWLRNRRIPASSNYSLSPSAHELVLANFFLSSLVLSTHVSTLAIA